MTLRSFERRNNNTCCLIPLGKAPNTTEDLWRRVWCCAWARSQSKHTKKMPWSCFSFHSVHLENGSLYVTVNTDIILSSFVLHMAVISYLGLNMDPHPFGEASGSQSLEMAPSCCHLLLSYVHFFYGPLKNLQSYIHGFVYPSLPLRLDYRLHEGMGYLMDSAPYLASIGLASRVCLRLVLLMNQQC